MSWSERVVLVTGASGIVGSCLVPTLLERGARVVVLLRDYDPQSELIRSKTIERCTVVSGELEDYAAVERALNEHEVRVVFHLGAQTIVGTANRSPLPTFEANIRGSYNLLEACRRLGELVQGVVIASSDKAYGSADELPYTEQQPLQGRHPYDVSKSCTDLLAQCYHTTYALPVAIARCGNIYGPGDQNWSRIVPGTIRSLLRGERPLIRSDGTFLRDYVYVQDAVDAYLQLAEALEQGEVRGEAFNFGPAQPVSVLELVERLRTLCGRPDLEPVILDQAKAEIRDQYLASDKARRMLAWKPGYELEDGLRLTIAWYREFLGL